MALKPSSPRRVKSRERMTRALNLRASGATYQAIADDLDITAPSAHALVQKALHEIPAEAVDELRRVELGRLDQMLLGIWTEATSGNLNAIDRAVKLMERRAKLAGLDAPALTADVSDWTDEELEEYATTGKLPAGRRRGTGTPATGTVEADGNGDTSDMAGADPVQQP